MSPLSLEMYCLSDGTVGESIKIAIGPPLILIILTEYRERLLLEEHTVEARPFDTATSISKSCELFVENRETLKEI